MRHTSIDATVQTAAAMKADVEEHAARSENRKQRRARLSKARHSAKAKRRVRA